MGILDDFPAELEALSLAGKYQERTIISPLGGGYWLEWTHKSDEANGITNEHFFPRYLPPFQPFSYPSPVFQIPIARFVSGRRIKTWREERTLSDHSLRRQILSRGTPS